MDRVFEVDSIEEFVELIGKQVFPIRKKIGEIILCASNSYFGPLQYGLKGKRFYRRSPQKIWTPVERSRSCHPEDSLYLANELGRPFHKILTLPLDSSYTEERCRPLLYIEYLGSIQVIEKVFCKNVRHILRTAFSRVLLEDHLRSGHELWQKTFDRLKEPIVILNQDRKPIRSNTHFQNIYRTHKNLLEKNTFQLEGQIYEKQNSSISYENKSYEIEHFVNTTNQVFLREQMAQHKKMSNLGKMADDVTHHLNNPLTGIRSMAQILARKFKNSKESDLFLEVEKATHRCQNIIKNFVQFSKESHFDSTCDLHKIIHQTIPFLKTLIQTKELKLKLESGPLFVKAEPCLLQQVAFNLIKNALEAVDGENGRVLISSKVFSDYVELSIEDNGCGICDTDQPKLFNPFFTTKKEGTGLGLRISYQLIKRFGGDLRLKSQLNKGSCFTFSLPRVL